MTRPVPRGLLMVAFVAFVGLGVPDGLIGTGWPEMSGDLSRSIGDLGVAVTVGIAGFATMAALSGQVAARIGPGSRLAAAYVGIGLGALLVGIGPNWALVLVGVAVLGMGNGLLDPTVNSYVARNHGMRTMNLLHASFGAGATLGPLVMLWSLRATGGWRAAYVGVAVWGGLMFVVMFVTRRSWRDRPASETRRRDGGTPVAVPLVLAAFLLTTGTEMAAGTWAYSWLFEGRGVSDAAAAAFAAAFWAGLTGARLVGVVIGDRLAPRTVMGWSGALLVGGSAWMAADPGGSGGFGLVAAGAGVALVFPILVVATTVGFGARGEAMVGWGFAAASAGAAALPWIAGRLVEGIGFEAIGVLLVAAAAGTAGVGWVVAQMAPDTRVGVAEAGRGDRGGD